ncbi:MAG TPA: UvrD-helicase domain-containing protein [Solirubrobacteraceae bacterium]|jgi:ATP-dependent exoDNAse (exonuclease V) beta subunit
MLAPGDLSCGAVSMERLTGWELIDPEAGASEPRDVTEPTAGSAPAPRTLTAEQEHAVERRGEPLLLAAGAGSGKTSVLVERFVRAVREDGIAPERILAITFTERAAGELRARVRARLSQLGETVAADALDGAFIGTFHGFCARILRAHARAAGLGEEPYEILDEGLAGRLRRRAFADALGELVGDGRGEAIDLIAAYTADRARASVLGVHAELRSRGARAPRLPPPQPGREPAGQAELPAGPELDAEAERRARAVDQAGARAIVLWDELLMRFGERYEAAKRAREGLDFDDLELLAGELLGGDERIRGSWAERFELLMVDELQDVNPRQLALVSMLERENLFTVGDEWQSIYGFRHADVGLFREREERLAPLGQSLRLAHNFRARPELLQAVNVVFAGRFGETYIPLRAGRESAREAAVEHGEPHIELLLTDRRGWSEAQGPIAVAGGSGSGAADWREAEALALARRVRELIDAGRTSAGRVAVLLRGMGDIDCYEQALRAQGLHTLASAGSFWARQEVADLLAHLRALADPGDELALYGALAAPPVGLSSDALALLARAARERECGVWEVARDPDAHAPDAHAPGAGASAALTGAERERTGAYCAWLESERELVDELTLAQLLERAVEHGARAPRMRADEVQPRRLANVSKLIGLAGEWERSEGHDLRGFLDEASFQQGAGGMGFLAGADTTAEPDAPTEGRAPVEAVRLMSVHAAKGLEFDVVCVADLGRAPSVGVPDLLVQDDRVGVRLLELADPEPRPALDYAQLAQERREAQAREEDRIVYVAMTRARERLLLSGAVDFTAWPRERPGAPPIAWLGPALVPELPTLCAEAVRRVPEGARRSADAAARAVGDRPASERLAPVLSVDGTDVPLRCRLNTPLAAP